MSASDSPVRQAPDFVSQALTPLSVFADATPAMKILMVLLVVTMLAGIGVAIAKVRAGPHLTGGSAFLSALRLGGPLVGLLGGAYVVLMMFVGMANAGREVPMSVLAPGFAEAFLLVVLGLKAGVVAVICHAIVEARIDRAVLRS